MQPILSSVWQKYSRKIADNLINISYNPIKNYILPGMESRLIHQTEDGETLRIFVSTRHQEDSVIPHSHRFNLTCKVMRGFVWNTIWTKTSDPYFDAYTSILQGYGGNPGVYHDPQELSIDLWKFSTNVYKSGEIYCMDKSVVHSIKFAKDSVVLVYETDRDDSQGSIYLEPNVDEQTIHTFAVQPWMFKGEPNV